MRGDVSDTPSVLCQSRTRPTERLEIQLPQSEFLAHALEDTMQQILFVQRATIRVRENVLSADVSVVEVRHQFFGETIGNGDLEQLRIRLIEFGGLRVRSPDPTHNRTADGEHLPLVVEEGQ